MARLTGPRMAIDKGAAKRFVKSGMAKTSSPRSRSTSASDKVHLRFDINGNPVAGSESKEAGTQSKEAGTQSKEASTQSNKRKR